MSQRKILALSTQVPEPVILPQIYRSAAASILPESKISKGDRQIKRSRWGTLSILASPVREPDGSRATHKVYGEGDVKVQVGGAVYVGACNARSEKDCCGLS